MRKKIYEILRKYIAKEATYNLGKVEKNDDEIICYVDEKKIKEKEKYINRYNLIFKIVNLIKEKYKIYNLNKPVHYILKNINFDKEINIQGSTRDCHITFIDCTFTGGISIDFADHLTFINNKYVSRNYKDYFSIIPVGHFYISTRNYKYDINKIEFVNDEIYVPDIKQIKLIKASKIANKINKTKKSIVKAWLFAKEVSIINTDIINAESIEVRTNNLHLENEYIISKEIEIESKKIIINDTTINSNVTSIESPVIEGKIITNSNTLFINNIEVDKNMPVLENYDFKLQQERLELINSLKKIEIKSKEVIEEQIKRKPLTRILRK